MDVTVNRGEKPKLMVLNPGQSCMVFNHDRDEQDRLFFIAQLKAIVPKNPGSQFLIDQAILAVGGVPEKDFGPNYELLKQ